MKTIEVLIHKSKSVLVLKLIFRLKYVDITRFKEYNSDFYLIELTDFFSWFHCLKSVIDNIKDYTLIKNY